MRVHLVWGPKRSGCGVTLLRWLPEEFLVSLKKDTHCIFHFSVNSLANITKLADLKPEDECAGPETREKLL